MNLHKTLLLLLFAIAAGILVWLYRDSPRTPRNIRKASWSEIIADRDAEIRRAMTRGNRYAARTLVWTSAADLKSIFLLECRPGSRECAFAVCPVCGNLYATEYLDRYCPFCLTEGEKFVRFE
ncbi:MAG TPA: hypothetical protein H9828_01095 [Candidatus Alistipes intestinigallinarum]|uniref:Uncharacterized protein n=1 Tax=Candidatus Alistipes intestinigallinarum TaxID=2838440 RepID=A0A9D1YY51_9BACT|nr:hypothetical protein [Candidatus Alistipes intestinigallinarum]